MILGIEDQSPLFLVLLMLSNFYQAQACLFHSPQEDIAIFSKLLPDRKTPAASKAVLLQNFCPFIYTAQWKKSMI